MCVQSIEHATAAIVSEEAKASSSKAQQQKDKQA